MGFNLHVKTFCLHCREPAKLVLRTDIKRNSREVPPCLPPLQNVELNYTSILVQTAVEYELKIRLLDS